MYDKEARKAYRRAADAQAREFWLYLLWRLGRGVLAFAAVMAMMAFPPLIPLVLLAVGVRAWRKRRKQAPRDRRGSGPRNFRQDSD